MWSYPWDYLVVVWNHWSALIPGGFFVFLDWYSYHRRQIGKPIQIPQWIFRCSIVIGLVFAGFWSWFDEHEAREKVEADSKYRQERIDRLVDHAKRQPFQISGGQGGGGGVNGGAGGGGGGGPGQRGGDGGSIYNNSPQTNVANNYGVAGGVFNIGQQPRKLTDEQIQRIGMRLRELHVSGTVYFVLENSSEDALDFANTIAAGLRNGGYTVWPQATFVTSNPAARGVWVYSKSSSHLHSPILDALAEVAVDYHDGEPRAASSMGGGGPMIPAESLVVHVGKR